MVSFFACTCPNQSGVDTIDNPDRFEQVLTNMISPKTLKNNFTDDFSMMDHKKMFIFGVSKDFISNFTYYNFY